MQSAKKPLILLIILYLCSLLSLWPGVISPDAMSQYNSALAGFYTDHHPPLMSLLWRYLNFIYQGPGLIFSLHLTLLYMAAAIFVYIFRDSKFKWWYAVYPLVPNMLAYTVFIVKDAGFVYCYLLSGAIISLLIVNRSIKWKKTLILFCLCLLLYGTAVKFQARYLLVFMTISLSYCLDNKMSQKNVLLGILLYVSIMLVITGLNTILVPKSQQSHSWQLVKLYDLTAMSIELRAPLYPDFIQQSSNFDFAEIIEKFNPQKIDDLVFDESPILVPGINQIQRDQLWHYWFINVLKKPILYLKIRFKLWSHNLTSVPSEYNDPASFLRRTALRDIVMIPNMAEWINNTYRFIVGMFKFIWLLPLLILYSYVAIKNYSRSIYSPPLAMFVSTASMLLVVLFFFSMAGVARYVLLATCFVHASHGFAYRAWRKVK